MAREPIDHGGPAALGRLIGWGIGLEESPEGDRDAHAEILAAVLERDPAALIDEASGEPRGDALMSGLEPRPASVGALLARTAPPLEALRAVKDWSRTRVHRPERGMPADAAVIVYYGAIATALAEHGERITQLRDGELLAGLMWAEALRSTPEWLHQRFVAAQEALWPSVETQIEKQRDDGDAE